MTQDKQESLSDCHLRLNEANSRIDSLQRDLNAAKAFKSQLDERQLELLQRDGEIKSLKASSEADAQRALNDLKVQWVGLDFTVQYTCLLKGLAGGGRWPLGGGGW